MREFIESGSNIPLIHLWWSLIHYFHLMPSSLDRAGGGAYTLNWEISYGTEGERKLILSPDMMKFVKQLNPYNLGGLPSEVYIWEEYSAP